MRLAAAVLPKGLKKAIKARLIRYGYFDTERTHARELARTSKRIDICAAQLAHVLHIADRPTLVNKTCLEIGAGWVLSHSIVMHLLGAKRKNQRKPPHCGQDVNSCVSAELSWRKQQLLQRAAEFEVEQEGMLVVFTTFWTCGWRFSGVEDLHCPPAA